MEHGTSPEQSVLLLQAMLTSTRTSCTFTLARREGGGPGTKGLSLFLIPKFMFDLETGDLGKRNGVYVTRS